VGRSMPALWLRTGKVLVGVGEPGTTPSFIIPNVSEVVYSSMTFPVATRTRASPETVLYGFATYESSLRHAFGFARGMPVAGIETVETV
jgi:hypothetical protein